MKRSLRFLSVLLCLLIVLPLAPSAGADSSLLTPVRMAVSIGDGTEYTVRAYDVSYENNIYLSLGDLAAVLKNSEKRFTIEYRNTAQDGEHYAVTTGQAPAAEPFSGNDTRGTVWGEVRRNRLFVDKAEKRYYTVSSGNMLYMSVLDIQLMLDIGIDAFPDNGLRIYPDQPFSADLQGLKKEGYFESFSSVLLGDAESGAILFAGNPSTPVPIASTSKLMTYLLLAEAIRNGDVKTGDKVTISKNAAALSRTADAMVVLTEGTKIPLEELVRTMLLASSNECALAIAEHVAGSEREFVKSMNSRARELELKTARFYNPHGLPVYGETAVPAKLQNRMSAEDMFRLSAYILKNFPQITAVTSLQYANMPNLRYTTANSNPLVFNMEGVNGLKTGSTNRAGYCLVASCPVTAGRETHTMIAIVYGAENPEERGQAAEILLRYARAFCEENGFPKGWR
ncbi:MAG: D-alanyl-D-alanine carboxypeptidase [Oscillospiraceae bacterium]|nr:D-alanyl-D-alanine carboxypeptidase [Oscillospiraceae bacterium]